MYLLGGILLKKLFITTLAITLFSSASLALTWQEALELAQKNNPQIKSAAGQLESARWNYYRSLTPLLPQLSASAALGQTTSGTLAATAQNSSYGLSVSQTLFAGFSNYISGLSAKANLDYYEASKQKAISDVYYAVRKSFIDLSIADENIKLLKDILARRKNNTELITLRYESGREDEGALLRTQADQADAAYNITSAERSKSLAQLKLYQLVSAEVKEAAGKLEALPISSPSYNALVDGAPAYIMYNKQLLKSELAFRKTASEFLPSVALSGSYRKSGSDWPPVSDSNSISLSLSYSFFPGGANIADRAAASADYDRARQDFVQNKNDLRYAIELAYESFRDAIDAQRIAQLSVDAASLRAEITRTKYMNGMVYYDEWDRIENDYINAQKNLLSRKKSTLYAEAAWYNSYGGYVK
jgi:outer membrane protein TolC